MANLNNNERLNLNKLINESDCENNTDHIRKVKHSVLIRNDFRKMDNLKTTHKDMRILDNEKFQQICQRECSFLFTNYSDIFNRLIKDELDLTIMTKLLTILKLIEDGRADQHEASVIVGKVLKELYVDSALKKCKKRDEEQDALEKEKEEEVQYKEEKPITWAEWRTRRQQIIENLEKVKQN